MSDFDALAATVAASKLHPEARPVLQDALDPAVRALVATHKDALGLVHLSEIEPADVKRVIVVDTRSGKRLGEVFPALDRPDVEWIVYDHHPPGPDDLPASPGRREVCGAATTLLVEALEQRKIAVTPLEATVMALGIYADTGRLTFPGTTAADARAVAWLLERGADLEAIATQLEDALNDEQRALLDLLVANAEPRIVNGHPALVVGARLDEYLEGIALIAHKLQALFDVDVIVVVAELGPKRTQFVGRSRLAGADLRLALAEWSPRGHARALSAHTKGLPYEAAVAKVWDALALAIPPEPTAADLMSTPVRTIAPDAGVEQARQTLLDLGHGGLVVLAAGKVIGVVSRRDLDRAARHGLTTSSVADVMARRVIVVAPDATLSDIEARFVEHDIGRVPVMRGEALLGVVTRQDVLRAKYDHDPARRDAVARQTVTMAGRLTERWPADWRAILTQVGAAGAGKAVYMVGGAVRDLLLDRPNLDVDLVVEGDGIAFAEAVAAGFPDSRVKPHRAFGTAHVTLPDGKRLDVATARTEHYERPGALPTVAFSTLKQDLARRDFSVNCLAMRIDPGHVGELIDFFGARSDLACKELRVLHNLSFVEDPTRILRAVRFELQLGFKMAPETEELARWALATGTFDARGGERNKAELVRILESAGALAGLARLANLGGLRLLDPALVWEPALALAVERTWETARAMAVPRRWLPPLMTLLSRLPGETAMALAVNLNLQGAERDILAEALAARPEPSSAIQAYETYKALAPETLAFLPPSPWLTRYWDEWRHVALAVNGNDLRALGVSPGPRYTEILRNVRAARLGGMPAEQEHELLERLAAGEEPVGC